ncbi:hypothetical protein BTJ40_08630 [Microbulbifer sp. A4B17]|nr:hypothetical protein BTJ40_08630 [Microbulbifer sp. A4B17]
MTHNWGFPLCVVSSIYIKAIHDIRVGSTQAVISNHHQALSEKNIYQTNKLDDKRKLHIKVIDDEAIICTRFKILIEINSQTTATFCKDGTGNNPLS